MNTIAANTTGVARLAWTTGIVAGASLPHWLKLPLWMPALLAVCILWRFAARILRWPLPGRWSMRLITLTALVLVIVEFRTINGLVPGTALLFVMLALKFLEARAQRDQLILIVLAYFLVFASVLDDSYVLLSEVNVGIAVDTKEGLVVPVVRHADDLTVRGIARAIDDIATKARDNTLTPDDLSGKTFTVSNPGRKGNLVGGAIISQPNVGILRTGEIKKRVVVVEHEGEDLMAIHPVMHMALSYDHRIVDGVAANGFLYRVGEILENADFSL
jgi:hypothetical protein